MCPTRIQQNNFRFLFNMAETLDRKGAPKYILALNPHLVSQNQSEVYVIHRKKRATLLRLMFVMQVELEYS